MNYSIIDKKRGDIMKLFSDCSVPCCLCTYGGHGCLAGYVDDNFVYASKEELIKKAK